MADPRIKALKIKTGVVKRLTKEKLMYIKETEQQREKVEKLKESGELNNNHFLIKYKLIHGHIKYYSLYSIVYYSICMVAIYNYFHRTILFFQIYSK